jgi:hypothetical protein
MDRGLYRRQSQFMDDDVRRQTQRRGSNLYAFRRLKWGAPPKRFAADEVLRGRYREQEAPEAAAPVEPLEPRRRREQTIDVLLWLAAAVSVVGLLWAVGSNAGLL